MPATHLQGSTFKAKQMQHYFKLHTHTALLGASRQGDQQRDEDFSLTARETHILPLTLNEHVSSPAWDCLPITVLCRQLASPDQETRTLLALVTSHINPGLSAQITMYPVGKNPLLPPPLGWGKCGWSCSSLKLTMLQPGLRA